MGGGEIEMTEDKTATQGKTSAIRLEMESGTYHG
jgi:hypothetical protein